MEILLIDDEVGILLALAGALRARGHSVAVATDGVDGIRKLRGHAYDLVISDAGMPGPDGLTILEYVRRLANPPDVVLMTASGTIHQAVAAIKQRASDFVTKPIEVADLLRGVEQIGARRSLDHWLVQQDLDPDFKRHGLVGRCAEIAHVRAEIDAIGPSDVPVLITGESGTGKELVARALHACSPRRSDPFVAINCASFPDTLLEAELFGHERGAFTGAERAREGRFAAARGGTILLDEVNDTSPALQSKLLRVLQERTLSPLGTNKVVEINARILSATNRSLRDLVAERRFREDLYYRVKVLTIDVPPLREREGDLALLCAHFLRKFAGVRHSLTIAATAWASISEHDYPGNVRELEHAIQHAVVLVRASGGTEILPEHLPRELRGLRPDSSGEIPAIQPLGAAVKVYERQLLIRALALCDGNKTRAARLLDISRKCLWEKLRSQAISDAEIEDAKGPAEKPE